MVKDVNEYRNLFRQIAAGMCPPTNDHFEIASQRQPIHVIVT